MTAQFSAHRKGEEMDAAILRRQHGQKDPAATMAGPNAVRRAPLQVSSGAESMGTASSHLPNKGLGLVEAVSRRLGKKKVF